MATRNRYAEIMAQYAQSQPYSFFGYPQSYTGGYDATAYTPTATPVNRYADIMAQGAATGGGGGRGVPEAPSAWSQMTPAERAAYYAANPTEGKIALGMQDLFGNASLLGQIGKFVNTDKWYDSRLEKMGYDPKLFAYGPPNLTGGFVSTPAESAYQAAITQANVEGAGLTANPMSSDPSQGGGRSGGGSYGSVSDAKLSSYVSQQDAANARDGGVGNYKGGPISMHNLQGPNPMGPDDGYGALKDGEYVINDKAVKKYGIELMNAINSGKISKGKLRGLLEM